MPVNQSKEGLRTGSQETGLVLWQRRLTVGVLSLIAVYFLCQVCAFFADILRILGISVLLSYLFINVVDILERYLRSRAIAILVVYALLTVITIFGGVLIVPAMVYQVSQLINTTFDKLPELINWLSRAATPLEARLHAAQIQVSANDILQSITSNIPKPDPGALINRFFDITMSTMTWLLYWISILVASFYFLLEGHVMADAIVNLFPKRYRNSLQLMVSDIDNGLQAFFRGQIVLGLLFGLVMLWVYIALGVPYALLLSVFLGIWEIVPVIGPPIGFFPAIVAVLIDGMANVPGNRLIQILVLLAVFQILQQIKDNVVAPRYIGNVIGLHPILIFIAIMIGARIDGMLGIIFALPVACALNVLFAHLPLKAADTSVPAAPNLLDTKLGIAARAEEEDIKQSETARPQTTPDPNTP